MALRWIEGFENFGPIGTYGADLHGMLTQKWDSVRIDNDTISIVAGRNGYGAALQGVNNYWLELNKLIPETNTVVVGFGWRGATGLPDTPYILRLDGTATDSLQCRLRRTAAGELQVYMYTTLIGTTSGAAITDYDWTYIEVKLVVHPISGSIEIRANEGVVFSASGIDTDYQNTGAVGKVQFYTNKASMIDDIYICDGYDDGTGHDDFLGSCRVAGLVLDGDQPGSQWDASEAGSHYALLNEQPTDGDTGYIQTDVSGNVDMFDLAALNPSFEVVGLQVTAMTKSLAAHGWDLYFRVDSNGTVEDIDSGDKYSAHQDYHANFGVSPVDPDTGVAWTPVGINNATFGIKAV